MKNVLAILVLIFTIPFVAIADDQKAPDLLGVISKTDLEKAPYSEWFNKSYQDYMVGGNALSSLENLLSGVEIKIVMGTWCHDSKREVPRFYKVMSGLGNAEFDIQMIGLDRSKQAPGNEIDGLGITNTPTFIFYRDGKELNRIVETPVENLETDMIKILSGENYRHSKMP